MAERKYRRFPRNETCEECPARRWYLEGGRRYCENGHQVEGYVEFDIDGADNYGKSGKTRTKKEAKEVARRHLQENKARELYLECLQLLLRLQIEWIVRERGVTPELERVGRDLWDLRVRGFVGLKKAPTGEELLEGGSQSQSQSQSNVGTGLAMLGSQGGLEDEEAVGKRGPYSRLQSWTGLNWALPGVMDTLAMVQIACVILRQPVRAGDVFRWAKSGQLPFLGASGYMPEAWIKRLPAWAQKALLTRYARLKGGELHTAVLNLMINFKEHFELVVPGVQVPRLLQTWIRDMALPMDVYYYSQKICSMFKLQFQFPTRANRHRQDDVLERYSLLDLPDVLMAASVVLTTTYLYPPDNINRYPRSNKDPLVYKMDWEAWLAEFPQTAERQQTGVDFQHLDPEDIWSMSGGEIADYLDWFQETQLNPKGQGVESDIEKLFPLKTLRGAQTADDMTEEEITARWSRVEARMVEMAVKSNDQHVPRLGYAHRCYREANQLQGVARRIYEVAADIAGLSLEELVKAVHALEVMMKSWEREERKRRREQGFEGVEPLEGGEGSEGEEGSEDAGSEGEDSETASREDAAGEGEVGLDDEEDAMDEGHGRSSGQIVDHLVGDLLGLEEEEL